MRNLGKFQIIDNLGSGHFGEVFLCFDPFLQKEQAVKVIRVNDPLKFVNAVKEGRALDICRHKHIVELKDIDAIQFEGEDVVIIVMEYLPKGSIQKHIERRFISTKEACKIISDSLMGLEHSHANNILHRDIKPGNILFGLNGEAKLSDFGLAIDYHKDPGSLDGYRPHQPLEVIEGQPMDKISDIYSMGVTFYRLINNTNTFPFDFTTVDEWKKAVKSGAYPAKNYLAHIPDRIVKIVNKAMHKDKTKRFKNCTEFRQAVEKLLFNVDWRAIDDLQWRGESTNSEFSLSRVLKRSGWEIDFKRNGRRDSNFCSSKMTEEQCNEEFIRIVNSTTLSN